MADDRRGFALVIVLIVVAGLFALALQGGASLRATTIETTALRDAARLEREARSAAAVALAGLTTGSGDGRAGIGAIGVGSAPARESNVGRASDEAPSDLPELPPEIRQLLGDLFKEAEKDKPETPAHGNAGEAAQRFASRDTGAFKLLRGVGLPASAMIVPGVGSGYAVTLADGGGQLNLNTAEEAQLVAYLVARGLAPASAESIAHELLDWRDADDFSRARGAERDEHLRRGVAIRNGPLQSAEELLYLPSITRELFERIRDDVTVAGDGRIHAGTAARAVLLSAPSMNDLAADRIIELRGRGELTEQTLRDALGIASREAMGALRLEPTVLIRLRVERLDGRASFAGDAVVTNEGVRMISLRRISSAPARSGNGRGAPS